MLSGAFGLRSKPDAESKHPYLIPLPHSLGTTESGSTALLCARMRLIVYLQHMLHGELRVALRSRQPLMAEQLLNRA